MPRFFLSVTESWLIWDQSFSLTFNFYVLVIAIQKYKSIFTKKIFQSVI